MKIKLLFFICFICLGLTSCNKEVEEYESKNIQVDSVFNKGDSQDQEGQNQQGQPNKKPDEKAQPQPQQQANPAPQADQKKLRTVDTTNLRRNPTTNDDNVVASVPASSELPVIEEVITENEVWIKTKYNNSEGFIRKDLLEEINN